MTRIERLTNVAIDLFGTGAKVTKENNTGKPYYSLCKRAEGTQTGLQVLQQFDKLKDLEEYLDTLMFIWGDTIERGVDENEKN